MLGWVMYKAASEAHWDPLGLTIRYGVSMVQYWDWAWQLVPAGFNDIATGNQWRSGSQYCLLGLSINWDILLLPPWLHNPNPYQAWVVCATQAGAASTPRHHRLEVAVWQDRVRQFNQLTKYPTIKPVFHIYVLRRGRE